MLCARRSYVTLLDIVHVWSSSSKIHCTFDRENSKTTSLVCKLHKQLAIVWRVSVSISLPRLHISLSVWACVCDFLCVTNTSRCLQNCMLPLLGGHRTNAEYTRDANQYLQQQNGFMCRILT